jgi:hypothetical protein
LSCPAKSWDDDRTERANNGLPLTRSYPMTTNNVLNHIMLAIGDQDCGLVEKKDAKARAQEMANQECKPVTMRHPVSDKALRTVKPTLAAAVSAPQAPGKANGKAKVAKATKAAPKAKAPRGMVVEILKLASRTKGVSPAELNTLTKWKGAPWKWLFKNPKGNGYCDRWGYSFKVLQQDDGTVRYQVAKR